MFELDIFDIDILTLLIQAILQVLCIFIGILGIRYYRNTPFVTHSVWFYMTLGFGFQLLRRFFAVLLYYGYDVKFITLIFIPTLVSICFAAGMIKLWVFIKQKNKQIHDLEDNLGKLRRLTERLPHDPST